MRVEDRVDVRSRTVDLRVQRILERGPRGAFDERAVEIDGDNVGAGKGGADGRAGIDEEGRPCAARATVAAVIDQARAREDPDRIGKLLEIYFHGITDTWIASDAPCPPTDLIA